MYISWKMLRALTLLFLFVFAFCGKAQTDSVFYGRETPEEKRPVNAKRMRTL